MHERAISLSPAEGAALETARDARRAAVVVGTLVGVPAVIAAGAALLLSALAAAVLLAPVTAGALTWAAWRYGGAAPSARAH